MRIRQPLAPDQPKDLRRPREATPLKRHIRVSEYQLTLFKVTEYRRVAATIRLRETTAPPGTIHDLFASRHKIRDDLGAVRVHVMRVIAEPPPEVATVPIGDLLCWCDGLDEVSVSRILVCAEVNWGRRIDLISAEDQKKVLWQIKQWRPDVWNRWKFLVAAKRTAA